MEDKKKKKKEEKSWADQIAEFIGNKNVFKTAGQVAREGKKKNK